MPQTNEITIAGVRLTKHAGLEDAYHYYRGTVQGYPVTFRPTLGSNRKPLGWRAYAEIAGAVPPGPTCCASGERLELAVQRAAYSLGIRARAERKEENAS